MLDRYEVIEHRLCAHGNEDEKEHISVYDFGARNVITRSAESYS